jgi:hypothetical protein
MPKRRLIATFLCALASAAASRATTSEAETADGYRGLWYMNQPTANRYQYKYSGGLGTYPQQHAPIAIYSRAANKTFFCYGGSTGKANELAAMVSYFDHATGQVPRPHIVLTKPTGDAHENPTLQLDDAGHVWIFCNTHGAAANSYIFRGTTPYSIDDFEQIERTNFSYSQPWRLPGSGFLFLHTRYENGRRYLFWMTSADGRRWTEPQPLARVPEGHYQISQRRGGRVGTAFNYHPAPGGLNARTNLYYVETGDMGGTWQNAAGQRVATPITDVHNAALVHDYQAEGRLVYLKDLNFDDAGRPVILYLTSRGYAPGPDSGPREWYTAHWLGNRWRLRPVATSDHNYDYGPLYVENDAWRLIAPTAPGPQPGGAGGEMVVWTSRDEGATWHSERQLTHDSQFNHTYARRPVDAHPQFYALWADGNPLERSASRLYFVDREGWSVWQLPTHMDSEFAAPVKLP